LLGLRVTQCLELGIAPEFEELQAELTQNLVHGLQTPPAGEGVS
jgi:lipoyl(octanoyl) transferase